MSYTHPTHHPARRSFLALAVLIWALAFALGVILSPRVTAAAEPTAAGLARGAVRIRQSECRMTPSGRQCNPVAFWSGTPIARADGRLWVLTCAHGYDPRSPVEIEQSPTVWTPGKFHALDRDRDLGLAFVADSGTVGTIPIAPRQPTTETELVSRAYPNAVEYREEPIRIVGQAGSGPGAWWQTSRRFISGESGGGIIGPEGLVGVIRLRENERDNDPNQLTAGGIVPYPTLRQFVETAFAPPADNWRPFQTPKPVPPPAPIAANGPPQSPIAGPPSQPPAAQTAPLPSGSATGPAPDPPAAVIDWSLVQIVVCVPRQPSLDSWDWLLRPGQQLATETTGPGATIRRIINDETGHKVDIRLVFERTQPSRYAAVLAASGLTPGNFAGVVALVKQQDSSLLDPLKNIAVRWGEKLLAEKLGTVPIEIILARTSPERADGVSNALQLTDETTSPTSWLLVAVSWVWGTAYTWWTKKEPLALWTR